MKNIVAILILSTIINSCYLNAQEKFSVETNSKKLINLNNETVDFKNMMYSHEGKVTLIEVWASWCSDCVKAMPRVKEIIENYPKADYVFISMDKTFDKWKEGIDKHELKDKGEHYWVTDGMKGEFGKSIDLDWIPRYILVDATGKIIIYKATEKDFDKLTETLKSITQ